MMNETAENREADVVELRPDQHGALEILPSQRIWTAVQQAALKTIGLSGCPDNELLAFLHIAQTSGLDPFRRQLHLLPFKTWNNQIRDYETRWVPMVGKDGFFLVAERHPQFAGFEGPEWCDDTGAWVEVWLSENPPVAARYGVRRKDRETITWGVAIYRELCPMIDEYEGSGNQRKKTGRKVPGGMWGKMPSNQLAKAALGQAVRASFPDQAGGIYDPVEMDQARQAEREALESERDKARRELVNRPWAKGPGGESGVVLDPDAPAATTAPPPVVTFDRTVLLAELEEQAREHGKSVSQWTTRWAAAHRKNIDDATDEELDAFLATRRDATEQAPQPVATAPEPGPAADETGEAGLTVQDVPRASATDVAETDPDSGREPGDGQESLLAVEEPPVHEFVGNGTDCEAPGCGLPVSDPIHFG